MRSTSLPVRSVTRRGGKRAGGGGGGSGGRVGRGGGVKKVEEKGTKCEWVG